MRARSFNSELTPQGKYGTSTLFNAVSVACRLNEPDLILPIQVSCTVRHCGQFLIANQNIPFRWFIQSSQQIGQSAFARTRWSQNESKQAKFNSCRHTTQRGDLVVASVIYFLLTFCTSINFISASSDCIHRHHAHRPECRIQSSQNTDHHTEA